MPLNCPACNAPIDVSQEDKIIVACEYCDSIIEKDWIYFTKVWEQTTFLNLPTTYKVMEEWHLWKQRFFVKWILRCEYDWWYFDRYCIEMNNGDIRYIEEDDGIRTFSEVIKIWKADKNYTEYEAGTTIKYNWENLFIQESWYYNLDSMKWIFDQRILPNTEVFYLDTVWKNWMVRLEYVLNSQILYIFKQDKLD